MYSKQEKAQLSEAFWTAFGRYLSPLPGAGGDKVNWINYRTGVRHITFRMEVNDHNATISIQLSHPHPAERQEAWQQLRILKPLLVQATGEVWISEDERADDYGQMHSRIFTTITGVNIYESQKWPELISFFKPRIIALDAFWEEVKYAFEI